MFVSAEALSKKKQLVVQLNAEREDWRVQWVELANYILPTRYTWLLDKAARNQKLSRNPNILDATGTQAARTLAAGLLNGITSPSRPWFKLRLKHFTDESNPAARRWLDEVERRMLRAMAETNFYNALAVMYLDLVVFNTAAVLIYEDYENVFRCYNCPLGEFSLGTSARQVVDRLSREYCYTVEQAVDRWHDEVRPETKNAYTAGGAQRYTEARISHLIEPNDRDAFFTSGFPVREIYWESAATDGRILEVRGYHEFPGITPRWEVTGNDAYGSGPGMDALGDIIQLQHEQKRKAQSLDYMLKPPLLADIQLSRKPTALLPGGVTFVQGVNNIGVKPLYTVQPPLGELTLDIRDVQARIGGFFYNDLFKMISQLETVRSATEIDARKEEKLVLLGPVLERNQNEALDPAINRVYGIMTRAGLLPKAPPQLSEQEIEIQYVSILSSAQSAVGVIPVERFLQLIGQLASVHQEALLIPNWDDLLIDYARDTGVKSKYVNSLDEITQLREAKRQQDAAAQMAATAPDLAAGAKNLSQADVGGGANALQMMLNG